MLIPFYLVGKNSPAAVQTLTWDAKNYAGLEVYDDLPAGRFAWVADECVAAGNTDHVLSVAHAEVVVLSPDADTSLVQFTMTDDINGWPVYVHRSSPLHNFTGNDFKVELDWQLYRDENESAAIQFTLFHLYTSSGRPVLAVDFLRGSSHDLYTLRFVDGDFDEESTGAISIVEAIDPNTPTKVELYHVAGVGLYLMVGGQSASIELNLLPGVDDQGLTDFTLFDNPAPLNSAAAYYLQVYRLQISDEKLVVN